MKALALIVCLFITSPCFAWTNEIADVELKPAAKSEDIVISNTSNGRQIAEVPNISRVDLEDTQNIVQKKETARLARIVMNKKQDAAYKMIPNKPSKIFHPLKRGDLWIDYHQDSFRKYRSRGLPAGQGAATVIGMVFSICAALK